MRNTEQPLACLAENILCEFPECLHRESRLVVWIVTQAFLNGSIGTAHQDNPIWRDQVPDHLEEPAWLIDMLDGFEADNLTFENAAGNTGQAVAITVRSDRSIFKHCRFLGDQDTLFADFGRQYYVDSYIEGGVDFIFGNAAAVFDESEIHIIRPGYLTAQSRTSLEQATGYVFLHARITAAPMDGKSFYLGRPWRRFSRVVFLSSEMPESLSPQGWSPWVKGGSIEGTFYGERGSTGPGARIPSRLEGSHQLSAEAAAQFTPLIFLAGSDHWNPLEEAAKLP